MVLVVARGSSLEATAYDRAATVPVLTWDLQPDEAARFWALGYDAEPAQIGLEVGPIGLARADQQSRQVAPADRAFEASVRDGVVAGWSSTDPETGSVPELEIPSRCVRFEPRAVSFPGGAAPVFAVSLDDDGVLLANDAGELSLLTKTGVVPLANPLGAPITNAWIDTQFPPTLWVRTATGAVWRGLPQLPLLLQSAALQPIPAALAIAPRLYVSGQVDAYVLTSTGALIYYDGQRSRRALHNFPLDVVYNRGDVARPIAGDVLAVYMSEPVAVRVLMGEVTLLRSGDATEAFSAVVYDRVRRVYVVGTTDARVLELGPLGWIELGINPTGLDIFALLPFEGGYLIAGRMGLGGHLLPDGTLCDPPRISATPVRALVMLGRDPVVIPTRGAFGADAQIYVLERLD